MVRRSRDWLPSCFNRGLFIICHPLKLIEDVVSNISGWFSEISSFVEMLGCTHLISGCVYARSSSYESLVLVSFGW